nr:immunoglobulin heavy chain junction region [Mus musculus]
CAREGGPYGAMENW